MNIWGWIERQYKAQHVDDFIIAKISEKLNQRYFASWPNFFYSTFIPRQSVVILYKTITIRGNSSPKIVRLTFPNQICFKFLLVYLKLCDSIERPEQLKTSFSLNSFLVDSIHIHIFVSSWTWLTLWCRITISGENKWRLMCWLVMKLDISPRNIPEILFVESEAIWIELRWIICLCHSRR